MTTTCHIHMPSTRPACSTAQGIVTTVDPIIVFHRLNTVERELWPLAGEVGCESPIMVGDRDIYAVGAGWQCCDTACPQGFIKTIASGEGEGEDLWGQDAC